MVAISVMVGMLRGGGGRGVRTEARGKVRGEDLGERARILQSSGWSHITHFTLIVSDALYHVLVGG